MILAFHKEKTWQLGIWQVEETISELLKMLPEEAHYEEQIQKFKSSVRRREWLASRVLLQTLCGEHKEVAYTASHRPYLVDGSCHISVSHTKGYVAVSLSSITEIGVDIEYISSRVRNIRHRFLSSEELQMLSTDRDRELKQLLVCWCTKEAVFKVLDREGVDFVHDLRIHPFELVHRGSLVVEEHITPLCKKYPIYYMVTGHYVITTCLKTL